MSDTTQMILNALKPFADAYGAWTGGNAAAYFSGAVCPADFRRAYDAYNALLSQAAERAQQPVATEEWRCFHCGEYFTDRAAAMLHFGRTQYSEPACQIDAEKLREMENLMARYQEEDTDLHRVIYGLHAQHAAALRREEEKGYARGLSDAALAQQAPTTRTEAEAPELELTMLRAQRYDEQRGITATLRDDRIAELEAQLGVEPSHASSASEQPSEWDKALEKAAQICETAPDYLQNSTFDGAAAAIRALNGQQSSKEQN